jgi:hypothetical protein
MYGTPTYKSWAEMKSRSNLANKIYLKKMSMKDALLMLMGREG